MTSPVDLPALRELVTRFDDDGFDQLLRQHVLSALDELEAAREQMTIVQAANTMLTDQRDAYRIDIAAARAAVERWRDRFRALVDEDGPDSAGNAVITLQHNLAAARAVLDDCDFGTTSDNPDEVYLTVDRAAWLAWQGRAR
jgi:hypothetical protein